MSTQNRFIANIGLGYWGKNILRNLHELGILHTACDSNEDTIAERKAQYPDVNFTTSYEDILKNPEIKAVAYHPRQLHIIN